MFRNKSANTHEFAMTPRADIPRSSFDMEFMHKSTMNSGMIVPFYVDNVLPGDSFNFSATLFARMSTPIYPIMDNMYLETFFFFVPYRLVWTNFVKMMGQQDNPGDSISYTVPQMVSKASGYDIMSLQDYFGLPTLGQMQAAATFSHSALPLRAYNLIFNEWFRDENLQNSVVVDRGDAPSVYTDYVLLRRGKRRDYFTSALPFLQKGAAVSMPLGSTAPVKGIGVRTGVFAAGPVNSRESDNSTVAYSFYKETQVAGNDNTLYVNGSAAANGFPLIYADLSLATSSTINAIRLAFQTQRFLERDARGGTRYTELLTSHFGVTSPDARLQRPEYLGGGSTPLNVNPIAQSSASAVTGSTTPLGQLGAMATVLAKRHGFKQSFVEHGVVIGLVNIRADLTYSQGVRKFWKYSTRYDFPWPVFSHLGEQAISNYEIYARGDANDNLVFGYQERYAEARYYPSMITGLMRPNAATTLAAWHLSQNFTSLPTLNTTFIQDTPPVSRVVAVPSQPEFIFDCYCRNRVTRPLPMYSVPGLIDHF